MKWPYLVFMPLFILGSSSCQGQTNSKMDNQNNNPLLCNPESGICEMPSHKTHATDSAQVKSLSKPVKIIYFTDPICSSCWGIEPQLRRLKLEYGNSIEIEYRMGGLLPDWSYNSGGISKPSDVAHHWDEVSVYYDMPIDGDVWLEDPLNSSYPPSIAFKAAQLQNEQKAILFLRAIREMVFLQKKNITKWEHLELAAKSVGLDPILLKKDYEGKAIQLMNADLKLGRDLCVRGFPTMIVSDTTGKKEVVYGSRPYEDYANAVLGLYPQAKPSAYDQSWVGLFTTYQTLTAKEYSELSGLSRSKSEEKLNELFAKGFLDKVTTKNGSIWKLKFIPQ